jgi:integrase
MPARSVEAEVPYFLTVREGPTGAAFWEVAWRHRAEDGTTRQVKRRVGPAWLVRDDEGDGWTKRPGRRTPTHMDERAAHAAAHGLVRRVDAELLERAAREREDRDAPVTFREVAHAYLRWLSDVRGAKPSTIRDYRSLLAEPGAPHRRGAGTSAGRIMAALGDRAAHEVTTQDVNALLADVQRSGASPRTVNKTRSLVSAIYNYAAEPATFGLATNPAARADRRREQEPATLDYYSPEEVEALARAMARGAHRDPDAQDVGDDERRWREAEDRQDADAVRLAAYTGLRRGELLALRWRDVDYAASKLTVRRAVSGDVVADSTKSGRRREVPLSDQATAALDRLQRRGDFTGRDDYVLVNRAGDRLDGSALRRRVRSAQERAGLRRLRVHDLRHTFGSLLVAAGVDLVTVQAAMGHARISTTQRYLHARPAHEVAGKFTAAFAASPPAVPVSSGAGR